MSYSNVFFCLADRIAPGQNKYMFSLFNNNANICIELLRFGITLSQIGTILVPVILEQEFKTINATLPTAGADLVIRSRNQSTPVPSGMIAKTGPSTITDNYLIKRFLTTNDEQNAVDQVRLTVGQQLMLFEIQGEEIGMTFENGNGFAVKNITNEANGSVSYFAEFLVHNK